MNPKPRHGLSVIEMLVAISIIGLLAAIIIPAVQASRESSRLTQCKARLAGLGRALYGYEAAHQ